MRYPYLSYVTALILRVQYLDLYLYPRLVWMSCFDIFGLKGSVSRYV